MNTTPYNKSTLFGCIFFIACIIISCFGVEYSDSTYHVRVLTKAHQTSCELLISEYGQIHRGVENDEHVLMFTKEAAHSHDTGDERHEAQFGEIFDFYGRSAKVTCAYALRRLACLKRYATPSGLLVVDDSNKAQEMQLAQADEIVQIVTSGPSSNRIDLVFMGDGYTLAERDRMFSDMKRLVADMFASTTFHSHLPLFNIWALFRASVDSGIGVGGKPLNTAFGLYRDGTELRGIYTSKAAAARTACREVGTNSCDFPTLIGNDDYYGGLGGEFTISTRSFTSGTIVLRHELGHNLINVGEEYDGGTAYFGVNHASNLNNIGWRHWLTNATTPLVAQQSKLLTQQHSWYLLKNGPFSITFNADGTYARWLFTFSISGAPKADSVRIFLDGIEIPFKAAGTLDRTFNHIWSDVGFTRGSHVIRFERGTTLAGDEDIQLQLCNYEVTEFMPENLYHTDRSYVGAYNTYRLGGNLVGYRPDHETCLMRNMSSDDFCVVCLEGMWMYLLARMSLIDNVAVTVDHERGTANVKLNAVPLAQLRSGGSLPGEEYIVTWTQNGIVRLDLQDKFEYDDTFRTAQGSWSVRLQYKTTEIRNDPRGYTTATRSFVVA